MVSTPWAPTEVGRIGSAGTVSLVDGATFVVSAANGDIESDQPHGWFVRDTRVLSRLRVRADGHPLVIVSPVLRDAYSASLVTRGHHAVHPHPDPPLTVLRHRTLGDRLREELELRNHTLHELEIALDVLVDADFASLFEVKTDLQDPEIGATVEAHPGRLVLAPPSTVGGDVLRRTTVRFEPPPDLVEDREARWRLRIGAGERVTIAIDIRNGPEGSDGSTDEPNPVPVRRATPDPDTRPHFRSDDVRLEVAAARALEDLAVLRITDPDHADRVVVAAGAPWFMALFGRDSIITAWMALLVDHRLAAGVLRALAEAQGRSEVEATEEEPGRILHEVRYDHRSNGLLGGSNVYYGTVDATPLFVMLAAEYLRWTGDTALVAELVPAIDRALGWIDTHGDRDGDGFVEYRRATAAGLANQGWKDSWDGIRFGDGRVAGAPIALAEVQAYVYAAYRARAYVAEVLGHGDATAGRWNRRAEEIRAAFDACFWLDDLGTYAVGLDGDKRPIDSVASNVGHCLWAGIVPGHRAGALAEILTSTAMGSGWGLRTLSADNPAFNPLSYHCGSVWPHDTAIAVAGLHRYGEHRAARALSEGLLDAASALGGRLPELFAGFGRSELPAPVAYPASCSPQAWAAASPLLLIRSMVGLEPDVPRGRVRVRRRLEEGGPSVRAERLPLGRGRFSLDTADGVVSVAGTDLEVDEIGGRPD